MKKLKIGFAAGFMDGFSKAGLDTFAQYQKELDALGQKLGFECVHYKKAMMSVQQARAIREPYPRLQLVGGVDKRPLIAGDLAAIDAELSRIAPLLERGGYIPHIDHAVPEDIPWDSFRYYRERLNEIIDRRKG